MFNSHMITTPRRPRLFLILGAVTVLTFAQTPASAQPQDSFRREDWVYSIEATAPDTFGINHWGLKSFILPYRGVQRGKHAFESSYAHNWHFDSRAGSIAGGALRFLSTAVDFALFNGLQNFDHVMGHDARDRELIRDYPGSYRFVSRRFSQVLPVFMGGKELDTSESSTDSLAGPDARTLTNSTLWEMRNQFFYDSARTAMAAERVNRGQLVNVLFHRLSVLQTEWEEPRPVCVAAYGQSNQPAVCQGGSGSARDYSNYLMDLNTGRYNIHSVDHFKLKISDLRRANQLQFLDPVFLVALYRYGADYIVSGMNTSRLPMIPLGSSGVSYLPGLRIDLSPFGIEYIQDNYIRVNKTLANVFWTRGDNRFEHRVGGGFDVSGIPLFSAVTAGIYGELHKQPFVSRINRTGPLTRSEFGTRHNVWHGGVSLRAPILNFGPDPNDPRQLIMTLKVGRKNTGWLPGEYIRGSTYVETGIGVRL